MIYRCVLGTPAPEGLNFTVGASSGLVGATGTLNRESFSRYTITVKVHTFMHKSGYNISGDH